MTREILSGEIDPETMLQLREVFKEMRSPVELEVVVKRGDKASDEALKFVKSIEEASPTVEGQRMIRLKISFEERSNVRTPVIKLLGGKIRFLGLPVGEELRAFVETIMRISEGDSGLSPRAREIIRSLKAKRVIQVIVTPPCPYCPYASLLSNMMAFESHLVGGMLESEIIEAFENPDIADMYGVSTVPAIVIDGKPVYVGVPTDEELAEMIVNPQTRGGLSWSSGGMW